MSAPAPQRPSWLADTLPRWLVLLLGLALGLLVTSQATAAMLG